MKGARALGGAVLVLAAACAVPAFSAAQDPSAPADATTTTLAEPADSVSATPPDASAEGAAAGTPGEAAGETRTADTSLADSPPADAPSGGAAVVSQPTAQAAASASVTMGDFFFSPATVSVAVGDTVTWRNTGQAPHNASADDGSFRTPDLNNGQSASETFSSEGTFSYICTIHPNMKGTVRVLASSSGEGGGSDAGGGGGSGGGGTSGSSSGGSDLSEADAVASPDAAGDSDTLPATGMAVGGLALVGLALLASGLLVRGAGRRWITPF